MMELVHFIAQDGDHFLGTLLFLTVVFGGIAGIVRAARGKCDCEK